MAAESVSVTCGVLSHRKRHCSGRWPAPPLGSAPLPVKMVPVALISPVLVRFKPSQKTPVGLATHANSITLTPGTITVEAGQNEFLVHALTRAGGAGVIDSDMDRRVSRVEGYR